MISSPSPLTTTDLNALAERIRMAAAQANGNVHDLLALLRLLEQLHREICDNQFQAALPTNRQALYKLLRDIETNGGWPYIPRRRLESFLGLVQEASDPDEC
ncbi:MULTISPECIES: hypothetical protein [unclassified Thermosynechococcus]|jgi:hypothetical protein|uniref:hypothetical protein n=1 Tax=unclassified Thermosynechococcus TaxID=2622553 RepID=UPI00059EC2A5|nr:MULTISPECIES: hypothetical protein [unclassified Thermosynechococcus]RMH67974.1 MAG: hypothetical protein D6676_00475 [Cyanobacteria bacterium J003]HIK23582.1 hypothetical protein [Thermosynechococcus sp. M3746_W2019_013]